MVTLPLTAVAVCLFISAVEPQALNIYTAKNRINATVGGYAFFSVRPSAETRRGNWNFGATNIAVWLGADADISNEYKTRAEIFLPNGSLLLKSVTASDSGQYTVTMHPIIGNQAKATITLHVLEPVSNVTVSANNSNPIENIDTILLTCHASGFVQSRIWFKNNRAIQDNDRIITSPNNVTLTIISVNRNDSGTYKCNAISDFISDSGDTILQINYQTNGENNTSSGAIAGIVIAALFIVCFISGITAWLVKRKGVGMNDRMQGQNTANINSTVNDISATVGENSAGTYENNPRKQKERAPKPLDENSTYMGLQKQN